MTVTKEWTDTYLERFGILADIDELELRDIARRQNSYYGDSNVPFLPIIDEPFDLRGTGSASTFETLAETALRFPDGTGTYSVIIRGVAASATVKIRFTSGTDTLTLDLPSTLGNVSGTLDVNTGAVGKIVVAYASSEATSQKNATLHAIHISRATVAAGSIP